MDEIIVTKVTETEFHVTVNSSSTTQHRVTVPAQFYRDLTDSKVAPEVLVRRSFEFLLQREPNTSILGRFELPVIGHYFPGYEQAIRKMLAAG